MRIHTHYILGSENVKVRVNLLMDKEVVQKAKDLGINLSKASENYLRQLITAIENVNSTKQAEIN